MLLNTSVVFHFSTGGHEHEWKTWLDRFCLPRTVVPALDASATGTNCSFAPAVNFGAGQSPWALSTGDFNEDGKLDFAVANANDDTVSILLGNGAGGFGAPTNFTVKQVFSDPTIPPSHHVVPRHVTVGDFNGDGHQDLAVANFNAPYDNVIGIIPGVVILLGNGTGSFSTPSGFDTFASPDFIAIGNLNSGTIKDLAVTGPGSGSTLSTNLGDRTG